MRSLAFALLLTVSMLTTVRAHADDAAIAELKEGYLLKQAGRYREAIPHLLASYRLSPSVKSLLNLSDCESRIGDLVSAKLHAAQGREFALQGHDGLGATPEDAELVSVADELLASIEKRMPQLTIKLSAGTVDCMVVRDGAVVDATTLGTAVAANPGTHTVTVRASGHDERTYQVTLNEGQRTQLLVEAGPLIPTVAPNPYGQPPTNDRPTAIDAPSPSLWGTITSSPRNEGAAALVAVGAIGVFVGGAFGIAAISNNGASNSNNHCDSSGCDPTGVSLRKTALSDATLSTVFVGVGLAAVGGGVVLFLTRPKPEATARSIVLAPAVGRSSGGLGLRGTW